MSKCTAIYHVEGHTTAGCFFAAQFTNMEDALAYWGCAEDWQDGEIAAEYFTGHDREVEIFWRKGF